MELLRQIQAIIEIQIAVVIEDSKELNRKNQS